MRFALLDLLFLVASMLAGTELPWLVAPGLPFYLKLVLVPFAMACVYFGLMYPFYRGLKLYPMFLPRCPCCGCPPTGYWIAAVVWPRVTFRCPICNGEFVVWHNGRTGDQETWEKPVLALKWPYAIGIYKRMQKPEPRGTPNGSPASPAGDSAATDESPE